MKNYLLLVCLLVTATYCFGQNVTPTCGSDDFLSRQLQNDPTLLQKHLQIEQDVYNSFITGAYGGSSSRGLNSTYTIPVVVHIIHNNGSENITDLQVQAGIDHLNQCYANIGYYDSTTGVSTGIRFCLAKQNPQGVATTGINRVQSTLTVFDMNTSNGALKSLSRWPSTCYLNIWLVKDIQSGGSSGVAGYATFPSSYGGSNDGIVVEAKYFGSSPGNTSVTAHEAGHYFGLYHTFQGGCVNNNCLSDGDRVCDTPPDGSTAAVACSGTTNSCSTDANSGFTSDQTDLTRDYMDYGNPACYTLFTAGQRDRMYYFMDNVRYRMLNCPSCNNPCVSNINAQFSSPVSATTVGSSVTFTNQSTGAASYVWYINNTAFSTSTSPTYVFNTQGTFIIRLKAVATDTNCVDYFSDTIEVTCGTQASFTQTTNQINVGQSLTFTSTSTGATGFQWFIDGVQQSTNATFTYTFSQGGVYAVYLIATGAICSDTTSITNFIHVGPPCNISYTHSPDTANTCLPVVFYPDTTCKYSNYFWTFCEPNFLDSIKLTTHNNGTNGSIPSGPTLLQDDNGDYYAFYTDYNAGSSPLIYRINFGQSIKNPAPTYTPIATPAITNLGNAHAIDIIHDGGNYYGYILFRSKIFRLGFGSSITNTNPTVAQVLGVDSTIIQWGHKIAVVRETNNYWLICASRTTGTITLLYLGNSLLNNVQSKFNYPVEQCAGFSYHKINGNHYIYAVGMFKGLKRLEFGNSLSNTPTQSGYQSYVAPPTIFNPETHGDLSLYQNCDGSLDGFLIKENNTKHCIVHMNSPTDSFHFVKYLGTYMARASNISRLFRTNEGMTAIVANGIVNGLDHISFGDCGVPYSTQQYPPPVSYNAAGKYYVRLAVDEGLPTQQVYCNYIDVTSPTLNPVNLGPDKSTCVSEVFTLHAGPGYKSYLWFDGSIDSNNTVYGAGKYYVRVEDNCNHFYSDTIIITVDSSTKINLGNDTSICRGATVALTATPGFSAYNWTPALGLSCATCSTTVATPAITTAYTVTGNKGECSNAGSIIITVANCTDLGDEDFSILNISPVPAHDKLLVKIKTADKNVSFRLFNPIGQLMFNEKFVLANNESTVALDVSNIATGIYLLQIQSGGKSQTVKVTKE